VFAKATLTKNEGLTMRIAKSVNKYVCAKLLHIMVATCLIISSHGVVRAQASSQEVLRKLARYLLQTNLVRVEPPSFERTAGTLYYYLGDVILINTNPPANNSPTDSSGSDPILVLLEDQLRIEALRRYYSSPEHQTEAFIEPHLLEAERLISKALTEIDSHTGTREQLIKKLIEVWGSIEKTLDKAVNDFAVGKSLDTFKTQKKVLSASYRVSLTTDPQGGAIFYVDEFEWRTAKQNNVTPGWREWAQTGAAKMDAGAYRFKVVWVDASNNRTESERTIDIISEGALVLRRITAQP
jgi:hypothetical protein